MPQFGAAQPTADSFRTLPSKMINGVIGRNLGERVENWLGMPLAPVNTGSMGQPEEIYQAPGSPGLPSAWEKANQQSVQQQLAKPRRMMPQR